MAPDHPDCPSSASGYPSDCELTQALRQRAMSRTSEGRSYAWRAALPQAAKIKLLLLDVDGVLTDGSITYTHGGDELKSFNTKDGLGIRLLQEAGVEVGIITARLSEAVARRAGDLGLTHVFQKCRDKLVIFEKLLEELQLMPEEVAYMGDDWLDVPLLVRVGFPATVADAVDEVKELARYVSQRPGGRGAVREVCDLILEAKGVHRTLFEKYLHR